MPGTVLRVDPPRYEVGRVGHALDVHAGVVVFSLHGTGSVNYRTLKHVHETDRLWLFRSFVL